MHATKEMEVYGELLFLGVDEPATYKHATKDKAWKEAMQSKIKAIEINKAWTLTELPPGHKTIGLKWVIN